MLRDVLGSDVNRLTALLVEVCERHRRYRDYTRHELHEALREVIAVLPGLPHLRARRRRAPVRADDVALRRARRSRGRAQRRPDLDRELLRLPRATCCSCASRGDARDASSSLRFQQLTGPAMAKGVEDTAFYSYNRLVVAQRGRRRPRPLRRRASSEFHAACAEAQRALAARRCSPPRPTTPSAARTCARASPCSRRSRTRWAAAVRRWTELQRAAPARRAPGPQHRVPALPDAGRRLADRRRAR